MKKLISILTTLCFLFSAFGADIAYAVTTTGSSEKTIENSISFIPFDLGRVIESKTFDDSRYTVINIQDLHCHIEAQRNIEKIIENLQKNYQIAAVFVEGGYDEVDTSIFGRVKDEKLRNNIIEGLFEKGRLTGAEYYYLKNDIKTPFYGLEDKDIHRQNLEKLTKALENNEKYNEKLLEIKAEIEYLKAKYFSKENHRFTTTFENYKYGKIPVERYYALLRKYIEKLNQNDDKYNSLLSFSHAKYPIFTSYCELLKAGKKIDYTKATFEIQSLVNALRENLSYNDYNKLSIATAGFSNIEELSLRLPELSKKYGISINEGSSLGQLIGYIEASRKLNPVEMLDEERRIAEDIRIAFSATAEEIEVSFLSDFYIYLESFLNTKITSDDYAFFEKEYQRFEKIYSKYAFKNTLSELKEDITFLNEYYKVNKDRNSIFVKNIEKRLGKNSSDDLIIVITGGFHSDGLNKLFTQNRISYISVMPSVTQETKSAEENYNEFLAMGSVFSYQTLALALASQAHKAEIAQMMIDIAAAELSDLPYNLENIVFIIESISEALEEKIDLNFSQQQTTLTLSNGFQINLKNAKGKIESQAFTNDEILDANKTRVANFLFKGVAGSDMLDLISPFENAGAGIFNPQVSKIVANIAAIAAKHNLITGDGLIFDIETNYDLPEKIGNYDRDDLRKMPERVQQAILKAYERDELINNEKRIAARIFFAAFSALKLDKALTRVIFATQYSDDDLEEMRLDELRRKREAEQAAADAAAAAADKDGKMSPVTVFFNDHEVTGDANIFIDSFGRAVEVVESTGEIPLEDKEARTGKFDGYKLLIAANRAAMSAVSKSDMDNALKYLGEMIEMLELMDPKTASMARAAYVNIERDWKANQDIEKHIKLDDKWSEEKLEQISEIHTLINAVHQLGLKKLVGVSARGRSEPDYTYSVAGNKNKGKMIKVWNFSKEEITPQVREFISNILYSVGSKYPLDDFFDRFKEFYVSGNIIICSVHLWYHSMDIVIDLDRADNGVIANVYDPNLKSAAERNDIENSRTYRLFGLTSALNFGGFEVSDYSPASGGFQVNYSAKNPQNIVSEYAKKFFLFAGVLNKTVPENESGMYRIEFYNAKDLIRASAQITASDFQNNSEKLNSKVLQDYASKIIGKVYAYLFEQLKGGGSFFQPMYDAFNISEGSQSPEEIERYIAQGRVVLDFQAKTAKLNERYNPYEKFTEAFAEFENAKKDKARDLLRQGYIIDNLPYEDLFFRPEAIIGNTEIKSGWLKLKDGRKLSVKTITKRWESAVEAAYAELVDINGKRSEIGYAQLKDLLEKEGYRIRETKSTDGKSDRELERLISEMKQQADPAAQDGLTLRGTVFAKGTGEWIKGKATYDIENNSEGKILIKEELYPDNIEKAGLGEGAVIMRGSEVMHSAISYREKKDKTGIIKFGRWEEGRLALSYTKVAKQAAARSNGYSVLEAEEGKLIIREGDEIEINGATGEILIGARPDKAATIDIESKISRIEAENNALKKYTLAKDLNIELETAEIDSAAAKEILNRAERELIEYARQKLVEMKVLIAKSSLNAKGLSRALALIDEAEYWKNYYGNKEIEAAVKELSDKVKQKERKSKAEIIKTEKLDINDESVYGSKSVGTGFLSNIVKKVSKNVGVKIFAPGGMAVGKSVFERYMEGSEFPVLLAELRDANAKKDKNKAKETGRKIQKLISEKEITQDIIKMLGLKSGAKYAVRSSGVGEDGKENAFAGMGNSYLNLSKDQVAGHILKTWESFYSERSIAYMMENGLDVMPAVLVQEMVEKVERAGVILNGVIGAVFGGGEGIVSGRFAGDTVQIIGEEIIYAKAQGRTGKIVNDERGGTKEVGLDKAERGARVLSEEEALLLNNIRIELEKETGYPADIEWSIDEAGNIHILQIRPVTDFVRDYEIDYENIGGRLDDGKLELPGTKKIAEKLGLKDSWLIGIAAIAAKRNLITGDGLIFDIETNYDLPEKIGNYDRDDLRKMPERVQQAILKAYERDEHMNSEERILARVFLAAYDSLGIDKAPLDIIYPAEESISEADEAARLYAVAAHVSATDIAKYDISDISTDKASKMLEDLKQGKLLELTFNRYDDEDSYPYLLRLAELGNNFADKAVSELLRNLGIESELYKNILAVMIDNSITYENNYENSKKIYIHINVENNVLTVINDAESVDSKSGPVRVPRFGEFNSKIEELYDGQTVYVASFTTESAIDKTAQASASAQPISSQDIDTEEISETAVGPGMYTDFAGRVMSIERLTEESSLEEKKEKTKKFNGYRALIAANRAAMSALGAADMDNALKYLADMIEAMELMDHDVASRLRIAYQGIAKDWADNRDADKHMRLDEKWSTEFLEQISEMHTLINAAHQQGLRRLLSVSKGNKQVEPEYRYTASYSRQYSKDERSITVRNYSEGEITPQVKEFISNVLHINTIYYLGFEAFHVYDNMIICSAKLGGSHNVEVVVDLDSPDDGIISAFYDPDLGIAAKENRVEVSRIGRIFGLASVLKNSGFSVADFRTAVGIQVRYSVKDKQNILSEYAEKFYTLVSYWSETSDRDFSTRPFRYGYGYGKDVNIAASELTTSDFQNDSPKLKAKVLQDYIKLINNSDCQDIFAAIKRSQKFFEPFYSALGIPASRQSPEEIERYIAEGRATADFKAKTANLNERYNPYEKFTEAFSEFENAKKDKARDLQRQGYIIDNLPYEDLLFRPEAIIGNTEIKSGWLKLQDGRKLSVKAITKRSESTVEAAYAELVDINGIRSEIEYAQLKDLLEKEGFEITETKFTDRKSDKELGKIISEMKLPADPGAEKGLILKGTVFAKGTGEWIKGKATYDIENNSEGKILIKEEFSPHDVEGAQLGEGIIVMRGSEVMHSAISYREKKNKAGIIKFGRWENGRLVLSYTKTAKKAAVQSNGYSVLEAQEGKLVIREGDEIEINGATGEILRGLRPDKTQMIGEQYINAKIIRIKTELNAPKRYTLAKDLNIELEIAGINSVEAKEILNQAENELIEYALQNLAEIKTLTQKSSLSSIESARALALIDEAEYWKNYYGNKEIEAAVKELSDKVKQKESKSKAEIIKTDKLDISDVSVYGSKNVGTGFLSNIVKKVSKNIGIKIFAPAGTAVAKSIFEKHMEGSEFASLLAELREANAQKDKNKAKEAGRKIQKLISEKNIEKDIIKALALKNGVMYAVRSSGVGEDGKENAFAGMGHSYLNLSKDEAVQHILKVWESFYSERSIAYMMENGLDVMPAVLVQEMVENVERAGVILNGTIGAVFGGGEGIVSGRFAGDMVQITGEEIIYAKASGRTGKIVNDERGGTKEVGLTKAERGARVLSEEEALLLNNIRIELEKETGYPADIEWAIDEAGNIHILQIRPVTDFVRDYEIDYENAEGRLDDGNLELPGTKKIADKLGLKDGWLRGLLAGVLEFPKMMTSLPMHFVLSHYADENNRVSVVSFDGETRNEAFFIKLKGARKIIFGSWILSAAAITFVLSAGLTAVWAVAVPVIYNIFSHAYHNVDVVKKGIPEAKLEGGYGYGYKSEGEIAESEAAAKAKEKKFLEYLRNYRGFLRSNTWVLFEDNTVELRHNSASSEYRNPFTVILDEENKMEVKIYNRENILRDSFLQAVVQVYYGGKYDFTHAFYIVGYGKEGEGIKIHGFNDGDTVVLGKDAENQYEFNFDKAANVAGKHAMIRFSGNNVEVADWSGIGTKVILLDYTMWGLDDNRVYEAQKRLSIFYPSRFSGMGRLTLPWLKPVISLLKFFGTSEKMQETVVAVIELPLIMLAAVSPSFNETFIKWHRSITAEQERERYWGMSFIRRAMIYAWHASASRVTNGSPIIRSIQRITFGIAGIFSANIKAHVKYNLEHPEAKLDLGYRTRQLSLFDGRNDLLTERKELVSAGWTHRMAEVEMQEERLNYINQKIADSLGSFTREELLTAFSEREIPYLEIIKIRNNERALTNFINETEDISLKLFALIYLVRINNNYAPSDSLRMGFEEMLASYALTVENGFEFKAALAGFNLIAAGILVSGKEIKSFSAQDNRSIYGAINKAPFLLAESIVLDTADKQADMLKRMLNIINRSIRAELNINDIADLWKTQKARKTEDAEDDGEARIVDIEQRERVDQSTYYLATDDDGNISEVSEEEYRIFWGQMDPEPDYEKMLMDEIEAQKAEADRLKAEWAKARKDVMSAAYDVKKLNAAGQGGEIRVALPSGETVLFKKYFEGEYYRTGICSVQLFSAAGRAIGPAQQEVFYNPHDLKGIEKYNQKSFAAKAMRVAFGNRDASLELPDTAAEADRLGLTGIRRAFFVARKEFAASLSLNFVANHYGGAATKLEKQTKEYKLRTAGGIVIKAMTLFGLGFGLAAPAALFTAPAAIPLAVLLAPALTYALNISTHAIYNLLVSEGSRLEIGNMAAEKLKALLDEKVDLMDNVLPLGRRLEPAKLQELLTNTNEIAEALNFLITHNIALPEKELNAIFPGGEQPYLPILARSINTKENNAFLEAVFKDANNPLNIRLFALLYLKINKYPIDEAGIAEIIQEYREAMIGMEIKNDFDLRASITGMQLLLMDEMEMVKTIEYAEVPGFENIYEKIASAVGSNNIYFNKDFIFAIRTATFDMAYELGNNYLYVLAPQLSGNTLFRKMLHKLFAHTLKGFAMSLAGETNLGGPFEAFKDSEISEGKGLTEAIVVAFEHLKMINPSMTFLWLYFAETIAAFAVENAESSFNSQNEVFSDFMMKYLEVLAKHGIDIDAEYFKHALELSKTEHGRVLLERIGLNNRPSIDGNYTNYASLVEHNSALISEMFHLYKPGELEKVFTNEEIKYLSIMGKKSADAASIINDDSGEYDILQRLMFFSVLRKEQYTFQADLTELINEFAEKLKKGEISIKNDFDLQAVLTGLHLFLLNGDEGYIPFFGSDRLALLHLQFNLSTIIRKGESKRKAVLTYIADLSAGEIKALLLRNYGGLVNDIETLKKLESAVDALPLYSDATRPGSILLPKDFDRNSIDAKTKFEPAEIKRMIAQRLKPLLDERIKLKENLPDMKPSIFGGASKASMYKLDMSENTKSIAGTLNFLITHNIALPEKELNAVFSEDEQPYLPILARSINTKENNAFLEAVFKDANNPLKVRLFALLYLKINKYPLEDAGVTAIAQEYREAMIGMEIKNDFDLRASITGVQLLLIDEMQIIKNIEYAELIDSENIYTKIPDAVIVNPYGTGGVGVAIAALIFDRNHTAVNVTSHELGHNYLSVLAPQLNGMDTSFQEALHELFASTIEGFVMSLAGKTKIFNKYFLGFKLFSDEEYPEQEVHAVALGLMSTIEVAFEYLEKINPLMTFSWLHFAEAVTIFASENASRSFKSQSEMSSDLIMKYLEVLAQHGIDIDAEHFKAVLDMAGTEQGRVSLERTALNSKPSTAGAELTDTSDTAEADMRAAAVVKDKDNKNTPKKVHAHYNFTKETPSISELEAFGITEKDGAFSVPVYMINNMPERRKEFKFKNTGVKINGKSLWMSSEYKAFVIFSESAEFSQMEEAVKNDNRKINSELSKLIKKATGEKLKGDISVDWTYINTNAEKTSFDYDDDGSVSLNLSVEDSKFASGVADYMTGIRQVRAADTMAAVQNIYYFLDNVNTSAELDAVLSDFQKIGNGQMILDYSVLKNNLSDLKIQEFFAVARLSGIKIIADLRNYDLSAGFNVYREAGFDGILYRSSADALSVYDFALASDRKASVIEGYSGYEQLVRKLQETKDIKILNNSEITAKIASKDRTADRSIMDRIQILKVLKGSALLGALKKDRYTEDFVRNAAYGFDGETLASLDKIQPAELLRLIDTKNIGAVKDYLKLSDTNALMIYLDRNIGDNIEDKAETLKVQTAFLEAVLEKYLVSKTVIGTIVNKDIEKTLGKALRMQMQSGGQAAPVISAEEFKEQIRQKTAAQTAGMSKKDAAAAFSRNLQSELSSKVNSLAEDAFVKKDAVALAGIIELIPAIAEARLSISVDENIAQFDVRQIRSLLTAA